MKKTFLIAVALAAFPFAVCSQETVTLQTIIISARQSNPEIKMAQKAYLAANYAVNAETAWAAPLFGYDYMKDNGRIYIAQELSFPGKLSFKRSAVSSMARALNSRYRHKQLELDTNIKKTFWGYWLAHRKIEIFNENIALVSRFLGIAKSKYMVGKVTEADVLSASAELGRMQAMLTEAQYEADIARSELNTYMSKNPTEPLGPPESIEPPAVEIEYARLENKVLSGNYSVDASRQMLRGSLADTKLSKMEWLPDIMAEARISDVSDNNSYMASMRLPLYFWSRISEVKSTAARSEYSEAELRAEINSVRLSLNKMYLKYKTDLKLQGIYRAEILPSTKQAVEISESGYRAGKVDFQYLLDIQKKYLDASAEFYRLSAESRMYYAELELIAGGDIK